MKWFPVDSDSPNDPKLKAVFRRFGNQAGAGAVWLLWCYVANHGHRPGWADDSEGKPLPLQELADECLWDSLADCRTFLDFLAERQHIDPEQWKDHGMVFLPAMERRLERYVTKRKHSGNQADGPEKSAKVRKGPKKSAKVRITVQDSTTEQKTVQDPPSGEARPDGQAPLFEQKEPLTPAGLMALWNTHRTKGPKVSELTPQRQAAYLKAIRAKPNPDEWEWVIRYLEQQAWANAPGRGEHATWRATLDWLVKPGKLAQYLDRAATDGADQLLSRPDARTGRTGVERGKYDEFDS